MHRNGRSDVVTRLPPNPPVNSGASVCRASVSLFVVQVDRYDLDWCRADWAAAMRRSVYPANIGNGVCRTMQIRRECRAGFRHDTKAVARRRVVGTCLAAPRQRPGRPARDQSLRPARPRRSASQSPCPGRPRVQHLIKRPRTGHDTQVALWSPAVRGGAWFVRRVATRSTPRASPATGARTRGSPPPSLLYPGLRFRRRPFPPRTCAPRRWPHRARRIRIVRQTPLPILAG